MSIRTIAFLAVLGLLAVPAAALAADREALPEPALVLRARPVDVWAASP